MKKLTDQILKDVITPRPENSFKGTLGKLLLSAAIVIWWRNYHGINRSRLCWSWACNNCN